MQDAVAKVELGNFVLESDKIESFQFSCDLDTGLPKGLLVLNDISGELLSKFQGLEIGGLVTFRVGDIDKEEGKENDSITFCRLMIASIAEIPSDSTTIKGNIELLLVHPWLFFKDFSNHAYNGVSNSELIKKILKSTTRGYKFDKVGDFISESDDDGKVPRYKIAESDYDFIKNKILPYTSIKESPALFWIDEVNQPHLKGIEELFTEDPKAVGMAKSADMGYQPALQELMQKVKVGFSYTNLIIKVGDENIDVFLKPLKEKVMIDLNHPSGMTQCGDVANNIKVGKDAGPLVQSTLPISQFSLMGYTDLLLLNNRSVTDQSGFLKNTKTPLIDMFRVEAIGNFVGDKVRVGDIVQMWVPAKIDAGGDGKLKQHWISGKWLVKKVKHKIERTNNFEVTSSLVLVRPSFIVNTEESSLPGLSEYLGV